VNPVGIVVIIILILLAIGLLPTWPYATSWGYGYWPTGIIGIIVFLVILWLLFGGGPGGVSRY